MMQPSAFWECTLWEVLTAIEGYEINVVRRDWEIARFNTFYALLPHTKKNRLKRMTDVCRFPWDALPERLDKKEVSSLFARLKAREEKSVVKTKEISLKDLVKQ